MWLHSTLTSVSEGCAWPSLQSGHYPPRGRALSTCNTEDRVGPSAGLDIWEKDSSQICLQRSKYPSVSHPAT
jgi:hypothetical protein